MDTLFWVFAIAGTLLFIIRSALIFWGLGHEDGFIGGHDTYHDTSTSVGTETGLRIFSLYTITVFFMMAGWSGLAALYQFELGNALSSFVAAVIGGVSMVGIAWMFKTLMRVQVPGAVYKLSSAVGSTATVYQRITPSTRGVVQISLGGTIREIAATTLGTDDLESQALVEVTGIQGNDTVVVKKLENQ